MLTGLVIYHLYIEYKQHGKPIIQDLTITQLNTQLEEKSAEIKELKTSLEKFENRLIAILGGT